VNIKKIILGSVVVVVGLPLAVILIAIVSISVFDRTNGTIVSSGETREYLLHVPDSYDRAKPTPLVISLHAGATWPAHQMNLSHWNRLADEHGFIVVYPSSTPELFNVVRIWQTTPEGVTLREGYANKAVVIEVCSVSEVARVESRLQAFAAGAAAFQDRSFVTW